MKKLIGLLMIAALCFASPALAKDDAGFLQGLADQLELAGFAKNGVRQSNYGLTFASVLGIPGAWTALAVYNASGVEGDFTVGCYDQDGVAVAAGEFSLDSGGMTFDILQNFMEGPVEDDVVALCPGFGSVAIFGTVNFKAEKYVGLGAGPDAALTFSVVAADAEPY